MTNVVRWREVQDSDSEADEGAADREIVSNTTLQVRSEGSLRHTALACSHAHARNVPRPQRSLL